MAAYDSQEDEAFFGAIGRLTVSWSMMEAGIDFSVIIAHQVLGGSTIEKKRPRALANKLRFLEAAAHGLEVLAPLRDRITKVCHEVSAASENRHDMIHGFVVEHIEQSGEAMLIRIIHEDPIPRHKPVKVTTESVLVAAGEANKLATKTLDIATALKALMLDKLNSH